MPRVSVVIPLYQTEAYIGAALASVLAQTFQDYEAIVVDDGSRDGGPAIARATGDPRVRVVTQANRGLAGARNTGIREATGEIIALLDADDLWAPEKLACHVAHFDRDPDLDVSFSASRLIDGDGQSIGLIQRPRTNQLDAAAFFCRNPIGNGSVPAIRRRALDRIVHPHPERGDGCWFDESFRQSEDVECWMRLYAAGCRFGCIDWPLTLYRVNSGGLSANIEAQLATWRRFRDKVQSYAPEVVAAYGARAEAYQLRYLARRAVRSDDRATALRLLARAMAIYPRMSLEEPGRTATTAAASLAKCLLPSGTFRRIESRAMAAAGAHPKLRV